MNEQENKNNVQMKGRKMFESNNNNVSEEFRSEYDQVIQHNQDNSQKIRKVIYIFAGIEAVIIIALVTYLTINISNGTYSTRTDPIVLSYAIVLISLGVLLNLIIYKIKNNNIEVPDSYEKFAEIKAKEKEIKDNYYWLVSGMSNEQKAEIDKGIEYGLSNAQIKKYANPVLSQEEMKKIRISEEKALNNENMYVRNVINNK